jgi:hypothetical protein
MNEPTQADPTTPLDEPSCGFPARRFAASSAQE